MAEVARGAAFAGLGLLGSYLVLQHLGRTFGSTPAERAAPMPGDELVPRPAYDITHAATIEAAPEQIWPWLIQVGWHRGGWYTARWVDRLLFPANQASADRIVPELQHLAVGDFIPDGPPESACGFTVEEVSAPHHLVLRSTTHLPLSWRTQRGAQILWTWTFVLVPIDGGRRTRFLFRWRAVVAPWWVKAFTTLMIVPSDAIMSRGMLRGIALRAETFGGDQRQDGAIEPAVACAPWSMTWRSNQEWIASTSAASSVV